MESSRRPHRAEPGGAQGKSVVRADRSAPDRAADGPAPVDASGDLAPVGTAGDRVPVFTAGDRMPVFTAEDLAPVRPVDDRSPVGFPDERAPLGAVRDALEALAPDAAILVAFSGGLDSTVLLDAAARCRAPATIVAWHVHHGLQPQADDWPGHCEAFAETLGTRFGVSRLQGQPPSGESLEEWARCGRYAALRDAASQVGAVAILTAHHADDQLETVLMRLARGTGLEGAAGIAPLSWFGRIQLMRPFLTRTRDEIAAYGRSRGLRWVEDSSNADTRRLRNAIRHEVLPVLERTLPGFRRNLLRSAGHLRAAAESLAELTAADLAAVALPDVELAALSHGGAGALADSEAAARARAAEPALADPRSPALARPETARLVDCVPGARLSRRRWLALPAARRAEVLRAWLAHQGCRAPSSARLAEMIRQLAQSGAGSNIEVVHDGYRLRRYRDSIELDPVDALASLDSPDSSHACERRDRQEAQSALDHRFRWSGEAAIQIPALRGILHFQPVLDRESPGLPAALLRDGELSLGPRQGGERLREFPGGPSRTLKNLFQERGVPPWDRDRLPVLRLGDQVLWVAGVGANAQFLVDEGERVTLRWQAGHRTGAPGQVGQDARFR